MRFIIMSFSFNIPYRKNEKLKHIIDEVKKDIRLQTFWKCSNVIAIDRLGYSDHGPTHIRIVANSALKLLRILLERNIVPSIVKHYNMKNEDAEIVVVLGSIFHDLGMIVTRDSHDKYSTFLAFSFIEKYLNQLYSKEETVILCSEILHTIASHENKKIPLTIEAGIVRIADALDMEEGRARIPFETGKVNIHSVSALSIKKVDIGLGHEKPIIIKITMSNSAGIFQIDELLKPRIVNSGLESYIHVIAEIIGEKEKKIIEKIEI
jgi:metal-dependent HD superfamily phosphatase/phosphodiesterase